MNDDEYREYLSALGRRHLRGWRLHRYGPGGGEQELSHSIESLSSVARFANAVAERDDDRTLLGFVAKDLRQRSYLGSVSEIMNVTGVLDPLDEEPGITFRNLRRSAIPEDDIQLLRRCGVNDPEAEILLLIHYSRQHFGGREWQPSDIGEQAQSALTQAADRLEALDSAASTARVMEGTRLRKTKLFTAIGRILGGAVIGAGNLLMLSGTLTAPNPAIGYGVLASAGLAISSMSQGIGDLRGE